MLAFAALYLDADSYLKLHCANLMALARSCNSAAGPRTSRLVDPSLLGFLKKTSFALAVGYYEADWHYQPL
jgi:hypothetical protein